MNPHHLKTLQEHHLYTTTNGKQGTPANLNGSAIYNQIIEDVNLSGIYFNDAKLMKTTFRKVHLQYAVFSYAYMKEASFIDCIMPDVSFNNSILTYATFKNVDLSYSTFNSANLIGANFSMLTPENLEGINFSHANLHQTVLPIKEMKTGKLYKTTKNSFFISKKIQYDSLVCLLSIDNVSMNLLDSDGIVHNGLPTWLKYSMKEV